MDGVHLRIPSIQPGKPRWEKRLPLRFADEVVEAVDHLCGILGSFETLDLHTVLRAQLLKEVDNWEKKAAQLLSVLRKENITLRTQQRGVQREAMTLKRLISNARRNQWRSFLLPKVSYFSVLLVAAKDLLMEATQARISGLGVIKVLLFMLHEKAGFTDDKERLVKRFDAQLRRLECSPELEHHRRIAREVFQVKTLQDMATVKTNKGLAQAAFTILKR